MAEAEGHVGVPSVAALRQLDHALDLTWDGQLAKASRAFDEVPSSHWASVVGRQLHACEPSFIETLLSGSREDARAVIRALEKADSAIKR